MLRAYSFYKQAFAGKLDASGSMYGWTGYTWDKALFPNSKAFLEYVHDQGVLNTLNIHPASGVQVWEETYEAMARAMGMDPTEQRDVAFNLTDTAFTTNWLSIVMKPLVESGVDFWWLDCTHHHSIGGNWTTRFTHTRTAHVTAGLMWCCVVAWQGNKANTVTSRPI